MRVQGSLLPLESVDKELLVGECDLALCSVSEPDRHILTGKVDQFDSLQVEESARETSELVVVQNAWTGYQVCNAATRAHLLQFSLSLISALAPTVAFPRFKKKAK